MSAPWWPPWTATSNALSATTVLPEPDVTLQQAVHGQRLGQIRADLLDGARLRVGQGEGELVDEGVDEGGAPRRGRHDMADAHASRVRARAGA